MCIFITTTNNIPFFRFHQKKKEKEKTPQIQIPTQIKEGYLKQE